MRRFEFADGSSPKFWEITVEGTSTIVHYGRLGTTGQTQRKAFGTAAECEKAAGKLILEKTTKGYVERSSSSAPPPAKKSARAASPARPSTSTGDARQAEVLATAFEGQRPALFELTWTAGGIQAATIAWRAGPGQEEVAARQLAALLALPAAKSLESLTLGALPGESQMELEGLSEVLTDHPLPSLSTLFLGDLGPRTEVTASSGLMPNLPDLHRLTLRAETLSFPKRIELPELRELVIETGALHKKDTQRLCAAEWPRLQRLSLWFGDPDIGTTGVEELKLLLAGGKAPALRHLGLRNCNFAQLLIAKLTSGKGAPLLAQLSSLDLSMGSLSDVSLEEMLAHQERFAHLECLDLSGNGLSDAAKPLAARLAKKVLFGKQWPACETDALRHVPARLQRRLGQG